MPQLPQGLAVVLMLATLSGFSAERAQRTTQNWDQVGATARNQRLPILVLVTRIGCGYCERLKREFLSDPTIQSLLDQRSIIRTYDEYSRGKITDFDGEHLRARVFLSRYEVFATPTLLFLDPNGRTIANPLVGYNDAVSYRDMVTRRLNEAQLALEALEAASPPAVASTSP